MSSFEQRTEKPKSYCAKDAPVVTPAPVADTVDNEKGMIGAAIDKIVNLVKGN